MKFIKRLFCYHDYIVTKWHWTHGPNNNDPCVIEYQVRCKRCGKMFYATAVRGSEMEAWLLRHKELREPKFD